jgi:hypothetical protein
VRLLVYTRRAWVWLEFLQPPFTAEEAAAAMNYVLVPENQTPSVKLKGPAQVQAGNRKVWLQIREPGESAGAACVALNGLIARAWNSADGGTQ